MLQSVLQAYFPSRKFFFQLARFHKPLPMCLIYLPCMWGVALCMTPRVDILILLKWGAIYALGVVCMRSAGCIFNDMCDAHFDAAVERTKDRPLAAGHITRTQAMTTFLVFLSGGFCIWLSLSLLAKGLSLVALALLFLYPYTKRFFVFPQLILGFAFNAGIIIAVAELKPALLSTPWPWILYGIGIFWTLYYDTLYAIQDLKDDLIIGIHSTAVFFKNHLKPALAGFYLAMNLLMAILGYYLNGDRWFYLTLLFGVVYDIGVDIRRFNPHNAKAAQRLFHHAILIGVVIFFLILFPDY